MRKIVLVWKSTSSWVQRRFTARYNNKVLFKIAQRLNYIIKWDDDRSPTDVTGMITKTPGNVKNQKLLGVSIKEDQVEVYVFLLGRARWSPPTASLGAKASCPSQGFWPPIVP